jgi:hypothetical protein
MPLRNNTVTPITAGFTAFGTGGAANLLNMTSGAPTTPAAGSIYWAAVPIPFNVTLTGIIFTVGTTGGTDKWIAALFDANGLLVANSDTAGINVGSANTKQKFAFTSAVTINGPGTYYVALQSNGTTARFLTFGNSVEGFVTGSTTGAFGTIPASLSPGTTYTVNVGPYATTY